MQKSCYLSRSAALLIPCLLLQAETNRLKQTPQYKELTRTGTEAEQADEAITNARSWHDSPVDDVFGGFLQSTVTCSHCHHQSHCFDSFLNLAVPIPASKDVSLQVRSVALCFLVTKLGQLPTALW